MLIHKSDTVRLMQIQMRLCMCTTFDFAILKIFFFYLLFTCAFEIVVVVVAAVVTDEQACWLICLHSIHCSIEIKITSVEIIEIHELENHIFLSNYLNFRSQHNYLFQSTFLTDISFIILLYVSVLVCLLFFTHSPFV